MVVSSDRVDLAGELGGLSSQRVSNWDANIAWGIFQTSVQGGAGTAKWQTGA